MDATPTPELPIPKVVIVGTLTDFEFMQHLLAMAEEGKIHSGIALEKAAELTAQLKICQATVAEITQHKIESDKSLRGIGHAIRNRQQVKIAEDSIATDSKTSIPKLSILAVLAVLTFAGTLLADSVLTRKDQAVNFYKPLDRGIEAMIEGKFSYAASCFGQCTDDTDVEIRYGRWAECCYRLGDLSMAEDLCLTLYRQRPTSPNAPFVQGLIFKKRGNRTKAEEMFRKAEFLGHPQATLQLQPEAWK